jgi:hypothetical protein
MYLICYYSNSYKAYNLEEVVEYLEHWAMLGDLSGLKYQLKKYKSWEGYCGHYVEAGHLSKDLKDVEFAPNVCVREQPKHLVKLPKIKVQNTLQKSLSKPIVSQVRQLGLFL